MALPREGDFPKRSNGLAVGEGLSGVLIRNGNPARGPNLFDLADELSALASDVRRIGTGRGANPETILVDKHQAADRIAALARRIGGAA